ncbi:GNAT family N-acetyltransferase [Vibrio harveyi]|uniref:hypothetical protein n=1 Tax=Vibrio harveyi TaxID=669 RepID=UPI0006825F21|nr:hypothetical protein [Vibrio harveyi]ELH7811720.1 GNAT family N-acetyltransferase [Vibrio harveyi]
MQGYRISTAFEEMDLDCIHHFISQSYWAKGVPRDTLDKAVRNSFCFGVFTESNQQIASHPNLQGLRRMMLATRDAHGLYEQFGFKPIESVENFMQIWNPDVYQGESQ